MQNQAKKRIGIITGGYPSPANPSNYAFVQQLAHAFSRVGVDCTVFSPVNVRKSVRRARYPYMSIESVEGGGQIRVYRPRFIQYWGRGGLVRLGFLNPQLAMLNSFTKSVEKTMSKEGLGFDFLYGHFLYTGGVSAIRLGNKLGIPAFPGMGESVDSTDSIWSIDPYGVELAKREIRKAAGVIVNSSLLASAVSKITEYPVEKIKVLPNGTDLKKFCYRNREDSRAKLGLPQKAFIVCCVGHYSDRKGQDRVLKAVESLDDVSVVFAGRNLPYQERGKVLLSRSMSPVEIPHLLSSSDIFVLPTKGEGSCNAIVEAMACGLPVVSSKGKFNDDLLSEEMSIRVDPEDVDGLTKAILILKENPSLRQRLAVASLKRSQPFDVDVRARSIIGFMEQSVK
ncbi:MAG: glycosyltransferase [Phycisphaerae bacterium]